MSPILLTAAMLAATSALQAAVVERRVAAGADDAEESASGSVSLSSSDLELTYDGSTRQTVGVRFPGITIPRGSTVTAAWMQFQVDETAADVTVLTLRAIASDDTPPFASTSRNLSSRAATFASVAWTPAAWAIVGTAGADQRTPNLSLILQEIVNRPGWSGSGAMALILGGTGHRVACAYEGRPAGAALLHIEYLAPVLNKAPAVSAGGDRTTVPGEPIDLEGFVTDDGLPSSTGSVSTGWSAVSGPAPVVFEDSASLTTTATFTMAGSYVLRLTAQDGELTSSDDLTVTVSPPINHAPQGTIMSPAGAITAVAGTRVNFQGVGIDRDGDAPLRFAWDFGGAAPPRRVKAPGATVLTTPGVFSVRLTVSDPSGLADPTPDIRIVTVIPAPGSRTFYVSPAGNDSDDGSLLRPFRTIDRALPLLLPGDRLLLRQGVYAERTTVAAAGTALAPIIIASYPGERAVIDPALNAFRTPGNDDWELVDAALGEYRSVEAYPAGVARGYLLDAPGYENGRMALVPYASAEAFRSAGSAYIDPLTPFYVGPGVYQETDGHIHIRLAKTPEMHEEEARYGQVLAGEQEDPRDHALLITTAGSALNVRGSHLVFAQLTFEPGTHTIQLGEDAHHITFDGVTTWSGSSALRVTGPGVHDIAVVNARLYGDVPRWIAWSDAKTAPAPATLLRGTLVSLSQGAHDITLSYSHLRGGHDGVGTNDSEDNVAVHHCRIENFHDDAFELEGRVSVGRVAIYENYIANSLTAVAPGQDTPVFNGPLLVYRNIVALLRQPFVNRIEGLNGWNGGGRFGLEYMFKHGTGVEDSSSNAHYYHNTLLLLGSAGKGINITPKDPHDTRIANNLLMTVNGVVNRDVRSGPGQVLDGDLYWKMNTVDAMPLLAGEETVDAFRSDTGLEWSGQGRVPRRGTDPLFEALSLDFVDRTAEVWALSPASETPGPGAFLLSPASPAIGTGIAIPLHPVLGTLPNSRPGRDIGALPYGSSLDEFGIFPFTP